MPTGSSGRLGDLGKAQPWPPLLSRHLGGRQQRAQPCVPLRVASQNHQVAGGRIVAGALTCPGFGRWLRWLGGVPVDRSSHHGIVGAMAESMKAARAEGRFLWLALAPEGTRRYVEGWRSGFYHLALAAQVPLGLVRFDYARREVDFRRFLQLSGDAAADMAAIAQGFDACVGRHPQQASPIRLKP